MAGAGLEVELVTVTAARIIPDGRRLVVHEREKGGDADEPHPARIGRRAPIQRKPSRARFTSIAYLDGRHASCSSDAPEWEPQRRLHLHRVRIRGPNGCCRWASSS